jgi:hypothetical protein
MKSSCVETTEKNKRFNLFQEKEKESFRMYASRNKLISSAGLLCTACPVSACVRHKCNILILRAFTMNSDVDEKTILKFININ